MTTATKTANNGTHAATAFTQQAADSVKANMEAGQRMFNSFADTMSKGWNPAAFATPAVTMPAAFEKMTKLMNGMVEANAKLVTEMSAMTVEAMKTNARTMERTGELAVAQWTGKPGAKPVMEVAREIYDEAAAFNTKTAERLAKLNAEHGQKLTQLMDETVTCKTACCGGN